MDQYIFFAVLVVILTIIRYTIYLHTIYLGKTKPHAFTWLLWSLLIGIDAVFNSIAIIQQVSLDDGLFIYVLSFIVLICFLIYFLIYFLISILGFYVGERRYTRSDWVAIFSCFFAIILWQALDDTIYSLTVLTLTVGISYLPTIRKSYHKPDTEPPISYFISGLRYVFLIFAIPDSIWEIGLYILFLIIADWGFTIYIMIRRMQLGYSLHEYSKS